MTGEASPSRTESLAFSGPNPPGTSAGEEAKPEIKGYEIQSKLGRGGMGSVWRAHQVSTQRDVALKVMHGRLFSPQRALACFEQEVKLAARLAHPNVAHVYDSGIHEKVYYYVMELIPGKHLDKYVKDPDFGDEPAKDERVKEEPIKETPAKSSELTCHQIFELMCAVCAGVQHAHQLRVVHRDLKPSNILVTKDGQPHIVDFGLAKDVPADDASQDVWGDGDIVGTLAYMSPEQAAGDLHAIGTRSDVYSLGVILYRLLTDAWPYKVEGSRNEVLKTIREVEPARPSKAGRPIKRDHEAILLKCLKKDPDRRYQSVGELAEDMQNWLKGLPVKARLPNTWYVLGKLIVYYRVAAAIICLVAIILLSTGFIGVYSLRGARTARADAEIAAKRHEQEISENMALIGQTAFNLFLEQWHDGDAKAWQYLISLPQDTREYQAASFLLNPESGERKRAQSSAESDGDRLFWQFITAEHLLKNGDRAEARKAYQQCLAEAKGSGEWFIGKIQLRLKELQEEM